jgi:hypothetical protein
MEQLVEITSVTHTMRCIRQRCLFDCNYNNCRLVFGRERFRASYFNEHSLTLVCVTKSDCAESPSLLQHRHYPSSQVSTPTNNHLSPPISQIPSYHGELSNYVQVLNDKSRTTPKCSKLLRSYAELAHSTLPYLHSLLA